MDSTKIHVFLASIEAGSFSHAADKLGYTPSGVSQLVNAFEKEMGFTLLVRNKQGVTPTREALKILPILREILRLEDHLQQIKTDINGLKTGRITIGSYSSIAIHWLPGIIKGFQEHYPHIDIRLLEGIHQRQVDEWFAENKIDMAFFSYKEPMPYEWIPLAKDRLLAILPANHPVAKESSYPLRYCQQEHFIMPSMGSDYVIEEMFKRNKITPKISLSTVESFAALAMVEQGIGISIMNELVTLRWKGNVVKLPLDPPQDITMGIALPSLKKAAPAVKRFVHYAARRLKRIE